MILLPEHQKAYWHKEKEEKILKLVYNVYVSVAVMSNSLMLHWQESDNCDSDERSSQYTIHGLSIFLGFSLMCNDWLVAHT